MKKTKQFKHTNAYYRKVKSVVKNYNGNRASATRPSEWHSESFLTVAPQHSESIREATAASGSKSIDRSLDCMEPETIANDVHLDKYKDVVSELDFQMEDIDGIDEIEGNHSKETVTVKLAEQLRQWCLTNKVTHVATSSLLRILNKHFRNYCLPLDSRTLLCTPRNVDIAPMGNGFYWYCGISNAITAALGYNGSPIYLEECLSLIINIDGIAPHKSSPEDLWPILFTISELPCMRPLCAAIYYGQGKPPLVPYFDCFVNELLSLINGGMKINATHFRVTVRFFVCDSPARSFIKGTVYFNAEHGCLKCTVLGEYDHRGHHMSFPRINSKRREIASDQKSNFESTFS